MDDPRVPHILDVVARETFVDRSKLLPDATVEELGIASLDLVQTMFAIEAEYNIEIPVAGQGAGLEFATIGALLNHVLAVLDKAQAAKSPEPTLQN
ncbi:MAG: phosphopantetheine-binding protein [Alphaproteobacteria bacterium]